MLCAGTVGQTGSACDERLRKPRGQIPAFRVIRPPVDAADPVGILDTSVELSLGNWGRRAKSNVVHRLAVFSLRDSRRSSADIPQETSVLLGARSEDR